MTHSPLPWRVENTKYTGEAVFDACGDRVHVSGNALTGENMKLAVRAVNAHDALVAALEAALYFVYEKSTIDEINAALKLARGEV